MKKRWFFALRKRISNLFTGTFESSKKGSGGIEFATFRDYQPGDSVRSISYPQSLKRSRYVVRENVIEKGMVCLFVVDVSSSILYGPSGVSKREIQLRIMEILATAVAQNSNKVGFLLVTDKIEEYFEPVFGESVVVGRLDLIEGYQPSSKKTDLKSVFKEIFYLGIKADLVFILSDFYSPDFGDSFKLLSGRYDIIPVVLKDPSETTTFPKVRGGLIGFKDMETGEFFWGDAPNKISNVSLFKRLGLDYVLLKTCDSEDEWARKFAIIFEERKKWRKS